MRLRSRWGVYTHNVSGMKKNPNFWVRISSGGVGVFHDVPRSQIFFGGISRDLAGISQLCPKSLRKKSLCSSFVPYTIAIEIWTRFSLGKAAARRYGYHRPLARAFMIFCDILFPYRRPSPRPHPDHTQHAKTRQTPLQLTESPPVFLLLHPYSCIF